MCATLLKLQRVARVAAVVNGPDSINDIPEQKLGQFSLVRATGVEPALSCENQPLKLARLPIPPRAHQID